MKHGVWLHCDESTDAAGLVDRGAAAAEAGWDGVFVSDQLEMGAFPDPWVALAGIAERTEEVSLGTWVVPVPRHDARELANAVASLDRLSGGRVMFGTGLGNSVDYEPYGRPYDAPALGARLDESLEVMAGLWRGEPFSYDGEHYQLEDAEIEPTPVQEPRPPILSGAWWPNKQPFHRGARWDGIMPYYASLTGEDGGPHGEEPTGSPLEEVRESLAYYDDIADDPGDVLIPELPGEDVSTEELEDLGVTWQLATRDVDDERIRDGPPV